MERRAFLGLTVGMLTLASCAKAPPVAEPTPTVTETPKPPVTIFSGPTPIEESVRAVLAAAVAIAGFTPTEHAFLSADYNGLLFDLSEDPNALSIGFGVTMLNELRPGDPPAQDELMQTLAAVLQPSADLLATSPLEGKVVWAVKADSKLNSLADLKAWSAKTKKTVAIPTFVGPRPDGIPALAVAYQAKIEAKYLDDPVARREALNSNQVELAAFRQCDFAELAGLKILEDPLGVGTGDPMVVLLNPKLADVQPQAVLSITDVLKIITKENFAELETQIAGGSNSEAAAFTWLKSR